MYSALERKWRLFRGWSSGHPIWCSWQVTYRCNFRCRFCHYWHDPLGRAGEPTVADYADGARKLSSLGAMMVSLAGGEPLLRTDLGDIVREIGKYHFPFVTTNGWLVTPESAKELMGSQVWGVSVSIDYAEAAKHDQRRGMQGAWEQAWRAVEMLSQARVGKFQRINVISVLMDDNLDQIEEICSMAAKRGAFFMVQPYSHLKTGSRAYVNGGAVSQRLLDIQRRRRNFLSNPYYLGRFDQFLHGDGVPDCRAGRAFFNIDSTGDIAICVENKHRPVANLLRDSAQTILLRLRQGCRHNNCRQCWYNCRGEVEGLYRFKGLVRAAPILMLDQGKIERNQSGQ